MHNFRHPVSIGSHLIGVDQPPFVIAEISGNHNQSLDRAFELVDAAATAGVHALKLQTYTADTITLNVSGGDFEIRDEGSPGLARIFTIHAKAHTQVAARYGAPCARSAVFQFTVDETAVDFSKILMFLLQNCQF